MESILLVVVAVVFYYLYKSFQDYWKNPYVPGKNSDDSPSDFVEDIYKPETFGDKVRASEYGAIIALVAKVAQADGKVCELEGELIDNIIEDLAREHIRSVDEARIELRAIFEHEKMIKDNSDALAIEFASHTRGEYKKRIKVVELLLNLAYVDGMLSPQEEEIIIDIAAYLEITNDDFNKIYDDFKAFFTKEHQGTRAEIPLSEAYHRLGIPEDSSPEVIKSRYRELVKKYHPDILQGKGLDANFIESATKKLQEINAAYERIKQSLNTL